MEIDEKEGQADQDKSFSEDEEKAVLDSISSSTSNLDQILYTIKDFLVKF